MRELKLRKLATPLNEARKDPKIEKPALFVEQLFGRPLRSNPLLISLTPDNREEFLGLVREDFGRRLAIVPFICGLSLKELAEHEEKQHILLGFFDLFTSRYQQASQDARKDAFYRRELKMVAQTDSSGQWKTRFAPFQTIPTNAVFFSRVFEQGLIVYCPNEINEVFLHELIHSEDHVAEGRSTEPIQKMIDEGRAYFGQMLFCVANGKKPGFSEHDYLPHLISQMLGPRFEETKDNIKERGVLEFLKFLNALIKSVNWEFQTSNYPFMAALAKLSVAIDNPFLAFQISTMKPPKTRLQVEMPLTYYKDEIERATS